MLKLHEKAVDIAEYAIFEKSKGNLDKAKKLFEKALNLELDAISKLTQNNEALRSILYRSAISLAMLNQMIEKKDLAGTIFECDSFPEEFLKRLKVKNYNHHKIMFNIENQLSIILSQGNDFYIDIKTNYGLDENGNVIWLNLWDKGISDVSEIAKLSTIKLLDLSHNSISDISQLANLKNLSKLIIYDNNIKDISALASLPRLETINIVNNPIESIYNTRLLFQDINLISGGDFKESKKVDELKQTINNENHSQQIPEKPFSKQEFVESIVVDCDVPYEYVNHYTKKGVVELIKEIKIEKCENGFLLVLKDKKLFVLGKNVSHVVNTHIEQLFELCGIKYPILEGSHWEYFFFSKHLSEEEFNAKKQAVWCIKQDVSGFDKPEPNELEEVIDLSHIDMTYINKVREMETADHAKFLIQISPTGNIIKREGPPGTGKTYLASKYAAYAHSKEMKVIMISFTNAAVGEMRKACPFIDWKNIQTIYKYCRKLLGSTYNARFKEEDGTIQENLEENVDEEGKKKRRTKKDRDSWSDLWNKEYGELYPFSVDDKKESQVDDIGHRTVNSSVYGFLSEKVSILRHRRINPEKWHEVVEEEGWDNEEWENIRLENESFITAILTFYKYLIDFNKKHNLCDNIDWLEEVLKLDQFDFERLIDKKTIIIWDEANDSSTLDLALRDLFAKYAYCIVWIGDGDQCLFVWRGSNPDAMTIGVKDDEYSKTLSQSYRVPRKSLKLATQIIKQSSNWSNNNYQPTELEGKVFYSNSTWKNPYELLPFIKSELKEKPSKGGVPKVAVLTTCQYMLGNIRVMLNDENIRYQEVMSRYARTSMSSKIAKALIAYCQNSQKYNPIKRRMWTIDELKAIVEKMKKNEKVEINGKNRLIPIFRKGKQSNGKDDILNIQQESDIELVLKSSFAEPKFYDKFMSCDINWWESTLEKSERDTLQIPLKYLKENGLKGLTELPKVVLSTIFSYKGSEADSVILFTDMSAKGYNKFIFGSQEDQDSIHRLFYVAATRNREKLVIGRNAGRQFYDIEGGWENYIKRL